MADVTTERGQFTFYRSYWDSVKKLPKKDRDALLSAICAYALDEVEPSLSGVSDAVFTLIRPTLDTGRKKAANQKQSVSKRIANQLQTDSNAMAEAAQSVCEKEREKEKEGEIEIENDSYTPLPPVGVLDGFDEFWERYPRKVGKEAARKSYAKVPADVRPSLISAVENQKLSEQWTKEGGRFIPNPATWLNQGRWGDKLAPAKSGNPFINLLREGAFDDE